MVANAQATADYTVEMGFGVPHGFSTRVLAPIDHGVPTLNVAMDDVIDLVGGTTLLPEGTGPIEWHSDNTQELDSPFGLLLSDPDADLQEPFPSDAPYKLNVAGLDIPTDATCGATADAPCEIDGSSLFSGGNRFEGPGAADGHFFVQMTASPGTTLWATSAFSVNRLSALKINVVATGVDTQAFVDEAAAAIRARERDAASALHAKLSKASTSHKVGGKRVWDAYAGYDTDTFALLDFYPTRLVIKKGDKVRWHFSNLTVEQHGIAYPLSAAKDIVSNEAFIPVCDPDGDSGEGPDTFTVDFETFTCPSGELELDMGRGLTAESGDGKYPGGAQNIENSGFRGPNIPSAPGLAGGTDPWDLTFTKTSSDRGFKYICTFHGGFMNAFVVVRAR
jgi:plastocyanin